MRKVVKSMSKIKVKSLNKIKVVLDEDAYMPTKAHDTDAGFDLYAPYDFEVPNSENLLKAAPYYEFYCTKVGMATIDTGVHIELPKGTVGMIKSKSGLNVKHSLITEGVIDVGYTGSIVVKIYNLSDKPYKFNKGDKIAQLVIMPVVEKELVQVDKLEETERGNGGFGSTGK